MRKHVGFAIGNTKPLENDPGEFLCSVSFMRNGEVLVNSALVSLGKECEEQDCKAQKRD